MFECVRFGQAFDFLFDIDSLVQSVRGITCEDGSPDFLFANFPCTADSRGGATSVVLLGSRTVCMQLVGGDHGLYNVHADFSAAGASEQVTLGRFSPYTHVVSAGGLPRQIDVSSIRGSLEPTGYLNLKLTATDASASGSAQQYFYYKGESSMTIDLAPRAVISTPGDAECGDTVTLDGSLSADAEEDGSIQTYRWFLDLGRPTERVLGEGPTLPVTLPLGQNRVGLVVFDAQGGRDSTETLITVRDTKPPALVCPTPGATECTGPDGALVSLVASASDACGDVTIKNSRGGGADASGGFPIGSTPITFTAADTAGHESTCTTGVVVRDTAPPSLTMVSDPAVLWPSNHRLVQEQVAWIVTDRCDPAPSVALVSVAASEPDDAPGTGDGNTAQDIQDASVGTPDASVLLRAERSADGPGRVYTLTYAARDASGNTASALGIVSVPHDQGTGPEPVMLRVEGASAPGIAHLFWNAVSGAEVYDVIQGDLGQVQVSSQRILLGPVHVLAAGQIGASLSEGLGAAMPAAGHAFFYLVQYRQGANASGWGTESSPWPAEPSSCDTGCPGEPEGSAGGSDIRKRK